MNTALFKKNIIMTAVEWFEKEIIKRFKRANSNYTDSEWCFDMIKKISIQAKEMEKQQIIDAYADGRFSVVNKEIISYEQYYNETFNN